MSDTYPDRVRGELLNEWRVSRRMDVAALAIQSNLSVAQILQLENGGHSLFYTPAIKESAARKIARLLGGDPAAVLEPLDASLPQMDAPGLRYAVPSPRLSLVPDRRFSRLFRQPGLIATPILILIAVVWASGWLQQKWQQGGSQQFWRDRYSTVPAVSFDPTYVQASFNPTELALPTAATWADGVDADQNLPALSQTGMVSNALEPAQGR